MVAWWWIPIVLFFGACFGAVIMGICVATGNDPYKEKEERR